MREQLVGHLLGALEPSESKQVEMALADPQRGPELRRELECLRRAVMPLSRDRTVFAAPAGLAARTLDRVAAGRAANPVRESNQTPRRLPTPHDHDAFERGTPARPSRSRAWLDRAIIAATSLAACVLVAPLLLDSIAQARARRAERNLIRTSNALLGYAETHRVFPTPPDSGPLSRAGLYAPTLVSDLRLAADDGTLVCPDSVLSRSGTFRVPTLEDVKAAVGTPGFDELVRAMGGDYGYTLGHRDASGTLRANTNRRRRHHPIMADAPDEGCERSSNHPDGAHHVLFEDGHVRRIHAADLHDDDHLFKNHAGAVAAGVDDEDAVIGDSHHQP